MSWKSKLKDAGIWAAKNLLTLGIGYLVDRYASKKVATAVKGVLQSAVNIKQNPPPDLQLAIDQALKAHVPAKTHADELAQMGAHLGSLLEKNLSEQAAALRGKK